MTELELNNRFITVEGIDGAGKSTSIKAIVAALEKNGIKNIIQTKEPGGTPASMKMRDIFLHEQMSSETEVLLAFSARRDNLDKVVVPALERGDWVISDRFTDSTYAYQGYTSKNKEKSIEFIEKMESLVQGNLRPGLTIVLLVNKEEAKKRLSKTGKQPDKFESNIDSDYFNVVQNGFVDLADKNKDGRKYVLIDTIFGIENTVKQINEAIDSYVSDLGLNSKREAKKNKRNKIGV